MPIIYYASEVWLELASEKSIDDLESVKAWYARAAFSLSKFSSNHRARLLFSGHVDDKWRTILLKQAKNPADRKLRWLAAKAVVDGLHHELCCNDDCWKPSDVCVCLFCGVPAIDVDHVSTDIEGVWQKCISGEAYQRMCATDSTII